MLPPQLEPPRRTSPICQAKGGLTSDVLCMYHLSHQYLGPSFFPYANALEMNSDDLGNRLLPERTGAKDMTIQKCIDYCVSKNFNYAGLQYGEECYCGNNAPPADRLGAKCLMPCAGDANQICGNPSRLSIYKKSSVRRVRRTAGQV